MFLYLNRPNAEISLKEIISLNHDIEDKLKALPLSKEFLYVIGIDNYLLDEAIA